MKTVNKGIVLGKVADQNQLKASNLDVKYTQSSWEKMGRDLGNLIGSGWGKGVHEELNDVTKNLEKAEDNIATYDEDGIISFSHTDRSSQYKEIGEKLKVLKDFTGQVNTILSTEIDDPFYKEMDAYVTAVRDLDITEYSVSNSLGIKETRTAYAMGSNMTYEVKKDKINLEDIMNGNNTVGRAMTQEWKNYLENNPGAEDLKYSEYQKATLYSGAFEYESISDGQHKKEFWFNMAALATTVVVGIVCPPAGFALGAALGGYELLNAAVGKDLLSGRELGTGERWFRVGAGALGVFGGVKGLSSFSKNITMSIDEEEKIEKFARRINDELKRRKKLLSEFSVASLDMYERASGKEEPIILILLDGFEGMKGAKFEEIL
ncbi:pre-toxin TG domain-containing protein [Enterococcus sp. DIV0849a]|uniref:pre-toxin TG domain-containing protein n=1 Tax=unclassified Enterococcus TaxID=2608891 RepID=UPI0030D07412